MSKASHPLSPGVGPIRNIRRSHQNPDKTITISSRYTDKTKMKDKMKAKMKAKIRAKIRAKMKAKKQEKVCRQYRSSVADF